MLSRNGDTNAALKVVSELVSQRRLQDEVTGGWRGFNEYRARLCHRHAAAFDHELPQQRLAIMQHTSSSLSSSRAFNTDFLYGSGRPFPSFAVF